MGEMDALLASRSECPGDGNGDRMVDRQDLDEWEKWSTGNGGQSSWYDLNSDGRTDLEEKAIIEEHLGRDCAR